MRSYNKIPKAVTADVITAIVEPTTVEIPKEPTLATVSNCSRLNVRADPNKLSDVTGVLNAGDTIFVGSIHEGWAHIKTNSGIEGYVMGAYIKED